MNNEAIKKIADTYGYDTQSRQLIEEMAELTQAINKYWRKQLECGLGMSLTWNEFKQAEKDFDYSGGYYSSNKEFWEGMHQKLVDKWNTRKPMDNIVEKLGREKSKSIYDSDSAIDVKGAYTKAINIVKQ